jgi:hypothetical protein
MAERTIFRLASDIPKPLADLFHGVKKARQGTRRARRA